MRKDVLMISILVFLDFNSDRKIIYIDIEVFQSLFSWISTKMPKL